MRACIRSLRATYLTIDPRSLGLFRIGFALLLLFDLGHRFRELDFWYTNAGLLPNHTLLWRPPATHVFSFFFMASSGAEARLGFLLCAAAYVCLLVGYRTRTAQLVAAMCRISLNSRLAMLENGGDMVMNLLALFTLALPLGQRFSVDAWRSGRPRSNAPVVSLAVLGLILQFATIYFFNALSKDGDAWRNGEAVYFALHLDKYTTGLGVYMREHLPRAFFPVLTYGTLVVEWLGAVLIISPVFVNQTRLIAVCLMPLLHLGFAFGLNLGAFSPAMIAFYPLLLTPAHWATLERWFAPRGASLPARTFVPKRTGFAPLARLVAVESAVALLIGCIALEVLNDNAPVPVRWRLPQPDWAKAMIEYPRLYQGWHMFAPTPPLTDTMIYVDAITSEGMHVDPYNEVASRTHFPAAQTVPAFLDQSQFFTMYSDRIASPDYAAYRQALLEWIVAYPQRTGRPADCLVKFDAIWIEDGTAPMNERGASKPLRRETFLQYQAPADSPCKPKPKHEEQQLVRTVPH